MLGMDCQYNLVDRYIPRGRQSLNSQRFVHMGLAYRVGVQLVVVYIHLEEVDLVQILLCIHKEVGLPHIEQSILCFLRKD